MKAKRQPLSNGLSQVLNPGWFSLADAYAPPAPRRKRMEELGPLVMRPLERAAVLELRAHAADIVTSRVTRLTFAQSPPARLSLESPRTAPHFAFAYPRA